MALIWAIVDEGVGDLQEEGVEVQSFETLTALADAIADAGADLPDAVVVDARLFPAGRDEVYALVEQCADVETSISVFFETFSDSDIDRVVYGPSAVDQAIEIRTKDDTSDAARAIRDHVVNRARPPQDDDVAIGELFKIDPGGYDGARRRSLVSSKMGGFSAEMRRALTKLAEFPLQAPAWDPSDKVKSVAVWDKQTDGRRFAPKANAVAPLRELIEFYDDESARSRLYSSGSHWDGNPPPLLLTGDSGTGKSLVADVLGRQLLSKVVTKNGQGHGTIVRVNCASFRGESFEHLAMGAAPRFWSDVPRGAVGQFAKAAHGVLFLDELGDLSLEAQSALLTYLDDRLIRPGGMEPFAAEQHIIAATNRDLEHGVNLGWFRNDLLARFPLRLRIPSLAERGPDEIRVLIDFVAQDPHANPVRNDRRAVTAISREAFDYLAGGLTYADGNFRELTEVVHDGLGKAIARQSRVLELDDVRRTAPAGRFRADLHSNVVKTRAIPDVYKPLIEIVDQRDLQVFAQRESRAILEDVDENYWVIAPEAAYVSRKVKPELDES